MSAENWIICATTVTTVTLSFERQRSSIQSYRLVHTSARNIFKRTKPFAHLCFRPDVCASLFVLPSPWLHKNRKVECRWLYRNSESTQTKVGSDATQKFLYGSQPHLWFRTKAEGLHRVLLSAPAQRQQGRLLLSLAESHRRGVRYG